MTPLATVRTVVKPAPVCNPTLWTVIMSTEVVTAKVAGKEPPVAMILMNVKILVTVLTTLNNATT